MAVLGQGLWRLRQVANLPVTWKTAGLASEGGILAEHGTWTGCALFANLVRNKESLLGKSPKQSTDTGEAGGCPGIEPWVV